MLIINVSIYHRIMTYVKIMALQYIFHNKQIWHREVRNFKLT